MKVAIVHDLLHVYGGAEKFLKQIFILFPDADLFSVIDFFPEKLRRHLQGKRAETSFIQRLPFAKKMYHLYLPLMPLAIEQVDVTGYDLVLSLSYAVAKGVLTTPDQLHICYCHTPLRYAWEMQHEYLKQQRGMKKWLSMWILHKLRLWDLRSSCGVDHFVANSDYISRRIKKAYRRDAAVVYSGIELDPFDYKEDKEDFYVTASRLVSYKRVDLIVKAFSLMPNRKLYVIGKGPEKKKIEHQLPKNIVMLGYCEDLSSWLGRAKAFIFAAKEDFGLAPLEAQACGTPVIAYGKGGALETVIPRETGCFFSEQTETSLCNAVDLFEQNAHRFSPSACRKNAERFSDTHFRKNFKNFVNLKMEQFYENPYLSRRERDSSLALVTQ